jgi:hypothetical protein
MASDQQQFAESETSTPSKKGPSESWASAKQFVPTFDIAIAQELLSRSRAIIMRVCKICAEIGLPKVARRSTRHEGYTCKKVSEFAVGEQLTVSSNNESGSQEVASAFPIIRGRELVQILKQLQHSCAAFPKWEPPRKL